MKSHKDLEQEKVEHILEKAYPEKSLPFVDSWDIPNNWLKMHGYAMKKRQKKRGKKREKTWLEKMNIAWVGRKIPHMEQI